MPEGWGTLGPFRIPAKLKEVFKDLHKGKVEEQVVKMIQTDVEKKVPDWDKDEELT